MSTGASSGDKVGTSVEDEVGTDALSGDETGPAALFWGPCRHILIDKIRYFQ